MNISEAVKPETKLRTEAWSEEKFFQAEQEWQNLLNDSNADPLFMSWYWMANWWKLRKTERSKLNIIAVYQDGKLVGIAPLYVESIRYFKGLLRSNCLQYMGKSVRGGSGIRAEYLSFILKSDIWEEVVKSILSFIDMHIEWDEWYREDIDYESAENSVVSKWLEARKCYGRLEYGGSSYAIDSSGDFEQYCASLGKHTRLKLLNRRKLLESKGHVELKWLLPSDLDEYVEEINRWHQQRWGHDAFSGKSYLFLKSLVSENSSLDFSYSSMLVLDKKPLSVMINVRIDNAVYNIQIGFIDNYDKRISLGTLHIGYVLESAFKDHKVNLFDFLEGQGKYKNYKERIAVENIKINTMKWIKSPILKFLYLSYDKFLRKIRLAIKRFRFKRLDT